MYRLFARVGPDGLRPVAFAFQAHVEGEGQALVRRADEAAAARKAALKAAIENAKATGKDAGEPEAFQSSASVPEDHSPNSHSHQEEGAKTSGGG